jgi:succinate dehydrogenase / fumarate reductase cytochrome b subunit
VFLTVTNAPRAPSGPGEKSWTVPLQRLSGAATLVFLVYHVAALRLPLALGALAPSDLFSELVDTLSSTDSFGIPVVASANLFGLAATSYHFASGLSTFCARAGIVRSLGAARTVSAACTLLGLGLFVYGGRTIVYLATGSAWP